MTAQCKVCRSIGCERWEGVSKDWLDIVKEHLENFSLEMRRESARRRRWPEQMCSDG